MPSPKKAATLAAMTAEYREATSRLSSPVSGPLRYDFRPETVSWYCRRADKGLLAMLADDLETLTGERLSFDDVELELREAIK